MERATNLADGVPILARGRDNVSRAEHVDSLGSTARSTRVAFDLKIGTGLTDFRQNG